MAIEETSQIYNGDFLLVQDIMPDFPDGWSKIGGDSSTVWEWTGTPLGPRELIILHPTGPRAGILQAADVFIQAADHQRWEVSAALQTNPPGVSSYIRVYMGSSGAQREFCLTPSDQPEIFKVVFTTPVGTNGFRIEIGIIGPGVLVIHALEAFRRYPHQTVKLDEKGKLFANRVDAVGQIQSPVNVKLISPLPIPVSFQSTVTNDIRDITPLRDGIRLYSSEGNPLASTPDGMLKVQVVNTDNYRESIEYVMANVMSATTETRDISSLKVFSYAVHNRGLVSAYVVLGISPDGLIWYSDSFEKEVVASGLLPFTSSYFLRYVRLTYRTSSGTAPLTIWIQAKY
ncbi:hypothetical protein UF75_1175 [Desulfosporosinus sp. I2]|uniref:DUF6385 domain-containing protein n=1 Tax=Desulfosporosinus sp. I2 TaxID=1617025 RepID=UPI00061F8514|nr:DUF6385 domain-containing protein [Desulfosporosinus sp. I2]KJR48377.1 hypothetical protein UF75_1175 [Desulfosporosinus sp. I2]